jgi:RNA polymerase sigma factor (sigma-70 family)
MHIDRKLFDSATLFATKNDIDSNIEVKKEGNQKKLSSTEIEARFNAAVKKYGEFLRNTIAQICPKDLGIHFDDVEQDARLRLWRALQSERDISNLASYIYRITVTATIDAVRRVKTRREDQLRLEDEGEGKEGGAIKPLTLDRDESPDRVAERQLMMRKIVAALGRLPVDRRRAVGLHLEGMTSQEIANLLGWSEPRARNLVYRGLKDLRRELRAVGIDYEID